MQARLSPRQREALHIVAEGRFLPVLAKEDDGWHARWRAIGGDNDWVDAYVREAAVTPLTEDAEDQQHETLHDAWLAALKSRTGLVVWDDAECTAFAAELEDWSGCARDDIEARRGIVFSFHASQDGFSLSCGMPGGRRGLRALGLATYVWGALRGMRADLSSRPSKEKLAEYKNTSQKILQDGINRMKKNMGEGEEPTSNLVFAAFTLANLKLNSGDADGALELLNDPQFGPLTLIKKDSPLVLKNELDVRALRIALRALVAAQKLDDAQTIMDLLEKRVEQSEDTPENGKPVSGRGNESGSRP